MGLFFVPLGTVEEVANGMKQPFFQSASASSKSDDFRSHALIFGVGAMLIPVSGVLLLPLYLNYLSAEQFGTLEIVNQISNVLCLCFLSAGVYHATGTFYLQAKDDKERGSIAATVLLLYLTAIGAGSLLAIPLLGGYGNFFGVDDFSLLLFGLGGSLILSTLEIPYVLMRCRMESAGFVIVTFLQFLIRVFGTVIAVAWLGLGVWGVLAMYWISGVLFAVILFVREFLKGTFRPNAALLGPMFVFAIPFLPAGICTFIQINGDRFFLARWFDLETVGLYALAWKIAGCVAMLSALPMQRVWLVRQYEVLPTPDGPVRAARFCTLIVAVQLFVGLGLSLFCREILMLIGKEEYWKAAELIPLLILADVFLYANYFFEGPLFVYRRTPLKFLNALVATIAVLCLFAVLVPRYGTFGAATATILGNLILAVGSLILTRNIRRIDYAWLTLVWMLGLAVAVVWLGRCADTFFDLERIAALDGIGNRLLALPPIAVTKIALLGVWTALTVRFGTI